MKKILVLCAALMLIASSAFAFGADLSVAACPGGAGASGDAGALDCAGGGVLTLLGTFMPEHAMPDLAGIDIVTDLQIAGDVTGDAGFWDFGGANAGAVGSLHTRPSSPGCTAYTNTWQPSGSGAGSLGVTNTLNNTRVRVVALCYRPTALSTAANQKMWGIQLSIDASTSVDAGGAPTATGCDKAACIVLNSIQPRTVSGADDTNLTTGSVFGNQVTINSGTTGQCQAVPTKKRTWGQLKSLYR
jgi:hypothetical protein